MTTSDHDARPTAHQRHDVVVTGPGIDPRRRWIALGVAAVVFVAIIFALARWGAEPGNEVRFGFPEKVAGLALTKPDRAPEARNREVLTHYDRTGDGVATLVVEWLPGATVEESLGAPAGEGEIHCVESAEVICVTELGDGSVRASQRSSDERSVRDLLAEFLDERVEPDRRG